MGAFCFNTKDFSYFLYSHKNEMFRHTGRKRTNSQDISLASLLCLTAGLVNVAGFSAFAVLTTNVTGHVAVFAQKLAMGDFATARVVSLWMFSFLVGAFVSSFIINHVTRIRFAYVIPILTEIIILNVIAVYGNKFNNSQGETEFFAGSLLFVMGMQNALVSMISGSVVRTTHLTGMFTDLGIELAALFKKEKEEYKFLKERILLRLTIIFFFFLGGIIGGYLFQMLHYYTFFIPSVILSIALIYDVSQVRIVRFIRKFTRNQ